MKRSLKLSDAPARRGRRAACRTLGLGLGAGLLTLALSACGLKPRQLQPGEKYFWQREDQRSR